MTLNTRKTLKAAAERIDALSLRERALLFAVVLGALLFVALQLVFPPLAAQQKRLEGELKAKREQVRLVYAQTEQLVAERGRDRDALNRARIAELKASLKAADGGTGALSRGFVSPREMAALVEQVLRRNRGLQLVRIENVAPVVLGESAPAKPDAAAPAKTAREPTTSGPLVYKHGLRVEVKGEFADLVRYLQALEGLDWKVLWDEVRLETEAYPVSRLTVVIYTLSTEQVWLGV
jgi:MSHA biogenesis protein MshJ